MSTIITLPARAEDSLVWDVDTKASQPILWHLDLGLEKKGLDFFDPLAFHAHLFSLEQFVSKCWNPQTSAGLIIYRGGIDIWNLCRQEHIAVEDVLLPLACMQAFAEYIHRLIAYIPEEIAVYCLFDEHPSCNRALRAHLLSKERFPYVRLALDKTHSVCETGVCMPQDALCTEESLERLESVLNSCGDNVRIIPEALLTEEWEGIERLFCLDGYVSAEGKRKLRGFEASGGSVIFV